MVPHIAPESWPPWPASRTTAPTDLRVADDAMDGARSVTGIETSQIKEASMSSSPIQAVPFFITRPIRNRRNILPPNLSVTHALLHPTKHDNESPCSRRAQAPPLRRPLCSVVLVDICRWRRAPEVFSHHLSVNTCTRRSRHREPT